MDRWLIEFSDISNQVSHLSSAITNIILRDLNELEKNLTLIPVVAAALLDQNGRVLLQRRHLDGSHGGRWEFPGGKVIVGESPEMALVREIFEELGIGIDPASLTPLAFASDPAQPPLPREPYVILLYTCRKWQGDPQCLAGEAIDWFEAEALADLARQAEAMPPLDIPLVYALLQMIYPLANTRTRI
jgi:8-oxo-dGTP diphosphatase